MNERESVRERDGKGTGNWSGTRVLNSSAREEGALLDSGAGLVASLWCRD